MSRALIYKPLPDGLHPPNNSPTYRSTALRHPKEPLVIIPQTLSELTGPVYPYGQIDAGDNDLTRQHAGEPLGERIIVEGRVLDEDGRPIPQTLVEVWQANAAGRYAHRSRSARRAARPELLRRRPHDDGRRGPLPLRDDQARRVPVAESSQRVASGAHPLLAVRHELPQPPGHADVLPGRSAAAVRPDHQHDPRRARARSGWSRRSIWT